MLELDFTSDPIRELANRFRQWEEENQRHGRWFKRRDFDERVRVNGQEHNLFSSDLTRCLNRAGFDRIVAQGAFVGPLRNISNLRAVLASIECAEPAGHSHYLFSCRFRHKPSELKPFTFFSVGESVFADLDMAEAFGWSLQDLRRQGWRLLEAREILSCRASLRRYAFLRLLQLLAGRTNEALTALLTATLLKQSRFWEADASQLLETVTGPEPHRAGWPRLLPVSLSARHFETSLTLEHFDDLIASVREGLGALRLTIPGYGDHPTLVGTDLFFVELKSVVWESTAEYAPANFLSPAVVRAIQRENSRILEILGTQLESWTRERNAAPTNGACR